MSKYNTNKVIVFRRGGQQLSLIVLYRSIGRRILLILAMNMESPNALGLKILSGHQVLYSWLGELK